MGIGTTEDKEGMPTNLKSSGQFVLPSTARPLIHLGVPAPSSSLWTDR